MFHYTLPLGPLDLMYLTLRKASLYVYKRVIYIYTKTNLAFNLRRRRTVTFIPITGMVNTN